MRPTFTFRLPMLSLIGLSRILVVDDEVDVRELAQLILESEDYEVFTAEDGEIALRMIPVVKPDLILLDVILPGISGLDICRRLKRDRSTRGIKIIIFTALGSEASMMLDEGDKPDDIVLKPFSNRTLVDKVARLLEDE